MSAPQVHNASTYTNHGCRCDECKKSWAELNLKMRRDRRDRGVPPDRQHGLLATYFNYMCRCDLCKKAHNDREREKKRQKSRTWAIRQWANANGYNVSLQGPVPKAIQDAYDRQELPHDS